MKMDYEYAFMKAKRIADRIEIGNETLFGVIMTDLLSKSPTEDTAQELFEYDGHKYKVYNHKDGKSIYLDKKRVKIEELEHVV